MRLSRNHQGGNRPWLFYTKTGARLPHGLDTNAAFGGPCPNGRPGRSAPITTSAKRNLLRWLRMFDGMRDFLLPGSHARKSGHPRRRTRESSRRCWTSGGTPRTQSSSSGPNAGSRGSRSRRRRRVPPRRRRGEEKPMGRLNFASSKVPFVMMAYLAKQVYE